jgi:hypothetical protein
MNSTGNIRRLNQDEARFLWWSCLALVVSLITWLYGHFCECEFATGYLAAIMAGIAGGIFTSALVVYQQRVRKEEERHEFFSSLTRTTWKRQVAYQYATNKGEQQVVGLEPGLMIKFTYTGGRILFVDADYGPRWGRVSGQVEFPDDNRLVGHGSYIYTSGTLSAYRIAANKEKTEFLTVAHSGKYTFHLFPDHDQNTIRVSYEGLIPYPEARGFEVWCRAGMK